MTEFILQEYKHPLGRPPQRIIFTKNEYCDRVKMPGWDQIKECEPKDSDPYYPPGGNQFLSTYNRIGHMDEVDHFLTTTYSSFEQIKQKEKYNPKPDKRPMFHYLTFKCQPLPRKPRRCPVSERCAADYLSTMQDSYKMPHPCVLQPLSVPKPPFLQNRKLKWEEEHLDENKFFDDCYYSKLKILQDVKGPRTVSYDPIMHMYSDGSQLPVKIRKCIELPFDQIN